MRLSFCNRFTKKYSKTYKSTSLVWYFFLCDREWSFVIWINRVLKLDKVWLCEQTIPPPQKKNVYNNLLRNFLTINIWNGCELTCLWTLFVINLQKENFLKIWHDRGKSWRKVGTVTSKCFLCICNGKHWYCLSNHNQRMTYTRTWKT